MYSSISVANPEIMSSLESCLTQDESKQPACFSRKMSLKLAALAELA